MTFWFQQKPPAVCLLTKIVQNCSYFSFHHRMINVVQMSNIHVIKHYVGIIQNLDRKALRHRFTIKTVKTVHWKGFGRGNTSWAKQKPTAASVHYDTGLIGEKLKHSEVDKVGVFCFGDQLRPRPGARPMWGICHPLVGQMWAGRPASI